jgi:hypothetical protein
MAVGGEGDHAPVSVELGRKCGRSGTIAAVVNALAKAGVELGEDSIRLVQRRRQLRLAVFADTVLTQTLEESANFRKKWLILWGARLGSNQ